MAPASEFSMKLIPPRLIPLVENHLKDLKKRAGQIAKKTDVERKVKIEFLPYLTKKRSS